MSVRTWDKNRNDVPDKSIQVPVPDYLRVPVFFGLW